MMDGLSIAEEPQLYCETSEQCIITAALWQNECLDRIAYTVRPEHFCIPLYGKLYALCVELRQSGRAFDRVSLWHEARNDEQLRSLGGEGFIEAVSAAMASPLSIEEYGRVVVEMAHRRDLVSVSEATIAAARAGGPLDGLDHIDAALQQMREARRGPERPRILGEIVNDVVRRLLDSVDNGIPTGLRCLDDVAKPRRGEQVVIGAATSMGKSALAGTMALNAAAEGHKVLFYTLEMTVEQMTARFLSDLAKVPVNLIIQQQLDAQHRVRLLEATPELQGLPICVMPRPGLDVTSIHADVRKLSGRDWTPDLIILDYIQLMRPSRERSGSNRALDLGEVANGLKGVALTHNVPVITLSQVNRAVHGRDDHRPSLADLRDSGEVEQSADQVWLLNRPEYWLQRQSPPKSPDKLAEHHTALENARGRAEILIAKNRNGETKDLMVRFEGWRCRFLDLAA